MSSTPSLEQVVGVVREIARDQLHPRFALAQAERKADGSLLTETDVAAQRRIREELAARWPQIGFLGEETPVDDQTRALRAGGALWCLDPLDGTSNFVVGIPFFSMSLALLVDGRVELGVVYDPVRDEAFTARRGQGAWLNGESLGHCAPQTPLSQGVALVDFKRLEPALATRLVQEPPYSSQRSFGSVALDWCWVAAGRGHVYLHGRQKLWDYAAGSLILSEAGGRAVTLEGEAVLCLDIAPRSVAAALDHDLFHSWCDWLGITINGSASDAG